MLNKLQRKHIKEREKEHLEDLFEGQSGDCF